MVYGFLSPHPLGGPKPLHDKIGLFADKITIDLFSLHIDLTGDLSRRIAQATTTIMKTKQVPFDIYIPATEHRATVKVNTLQIDVYTDDFGNEMVTPESSVLIDKTQARYMGLLADSDIRALRERLSLSQDQLRLLEEKKVTPEDLRSVRQPRMTDCDKIVHFIGNRQNAPRTYTGEWAKSLGETSEPIAM